ncbi:MULTISPECIES: long-chain fatty acid--CoA ligase [unclassified Polaromonas]|uniref:long-chain fatty acid--CoA ligase n=1 Tax=unclassified Polaromonas TaxID=2638319 RepID=UPI000BCD09DB|nr:MULTISPECIES: long-chain fatty acid--CoA ligase [unclassified Polaromonas]OYY36716.1 MAG: long-chain fatty acid--CoA ligase [Polaromonas sp. 35-63-35]OYZ18776.1 MAG: long-chain fatty acid--CoA ligase [Polaromonas sp. 16-63-31]OYZ81435.1 MAG: long-chain fatty acid--CoA ligase [Polaromonas sp. 24-63-21]OZA53088.1 MAG: long-chain fatty acid--CoA ligase [Polaromonas sp. 17-63-33]OZA88795.1 MAG: long-chain fatty acid--CoA ligase [Polaromonas sp. 39-63-25]
MHYKVWPKRLPHRISAPATSLWHNLAVSALRYPNKAALVFFGRVFTYAEVLDKAERLAATLHEMGVKKGDRVVLDMQNCPQWVIAHFAILRADAVVVPVNPMNRAEELKHYITDPDARVAITAADLAPELVKANVQLPPGQQLQHLIVTHYSDAFDVQAEAAALPPAWQEWLGTQHPAPAAGDCQVTSWAEALAQGAQGRLPDHTATPQDLAVLPYTSGTTGLPKGCMHTHASIMHNAVASCLWGNSTPENTVLSVVPMFHITGMVSVMHASIYGGATLVIMPRWDRELAGRLISKWRVTHWTNIPTMVIDLLASPNFAEFDLSSLVYIGGGGAAMPQAVAQRLWEQYGLRFAEGYGLTETAAPSHSNPPDATKQQCLGVPFLNVDARVIDPLSLGEMPLGEQGEIIMCGPQNFSGYWKRPEATAAAFIEIDGKSFFRSGDLGRVDEEGYFFITDRLKRMINASGFKVWPAEVEALMFKHPAIQEACIISTRDAYRGETVKAVVVLRQSHKGQVSEADIIDWCKENMAAYKYPRVVQLVDALPKSGSGKVMWRTLQEAEVATA